MHHRPRVVDDVIALPTHDEWIVEIHTTTGPSGPVPVQSSN